MRRVPRLLMPITAAVALVLAAAPAFAHGHGGGHGGHGGHAHGHGGGFHGGGGFHHHGFRHEFFHHHDVFIGGGAVLPFGYPYYDPYYYDYPGAWTYVVPSPLYAAPLAGQCRTFEGDARIAGTSQPFYGSACMQPDGQWHIAS